MKKFLFSILILFFVVCLTGCMNSPMAFRSVVFNTVQNASTEGAITNTPKSGNSNVEAPKSTSDAFKSNAKINDQSNEASTTTTPVNQTVAE